MGRPRKKSNQFLPDNLRPKTVTRKSGKTVIYWLYRTTGKTEICFGTDRNQAFIKAAQMNLEREQKSGSITFGLVAKRYRDEIIPQKKTSTATLHSSLLKHILAFFADAPLDEIEPQHIREYLDRRSATQGAANNEIGLFSHIWNTARQWGYTRLPSPTEGVKKFPIKKREVYIDDQLYSLVYQYADQTMRDLMDVAYLTGQRPIDIVSIQRDQIQDGYLHIVQQKTETKVRIEIVGKLAEILNRLCTNESSYLFVSRLGRKITRNNLTQQFRELRKKIIATHPQHKEALNQFQFRDLRAKSGTDKALTQGEEAARQHLGHTNVKMTKVYIRKALAVSPLSHTPTEKEGK